MRRNEEMIEYRISNVNSIRSIELPYRREKVCTLTINIEMRDITRDEAKEIVKEIEEITGE